MFLIFFIIYEIYCRLLSALYTHRYSKYAFIDSYLPGGLNQLFETKKMFFDFKLVRLEITFLQRRVKAFRHLDIGTGSYGNRSTIARELPCWLSHGLFRLEHFNTGFWSVYMLRQIFENTPSECYNETNLILKKCLRYIKRFGHLAMTVICGQMSKIKK